MLELYLYGKNEPDYDIIRTLLRAGFDCRMLKIKDFKTVRPLLLECLIEHHLALAVMMEREAKIKGTEAKPRIMKVLYPEIFKYS